MAQHKSITQTASITNIYAMKSSFSCLFVFVLDLVLLLIIGVNNLRLLGLFICKVQEVPPIVNEC